MSSSVRWTLRGSTMVLNKSTSDMLDLSRHVENEVRADSAVLAKILGRRITVESADGVVLERFTAEPS